MKFQLSKFKNQFQIKNQYLYRIDLYQEQSLKCNRQLDRLSKRDFERLMTRSSTRLKPNSLRRSSTNWWISPTSSPTFFLCIVFLMVSSISDNYGFFKTSPTTWSSADRFWMIWFYRAVPLTTITRLKSVSNWSTVLDIPSYPHINNHE